MQVDVKDFILVWVGWVCAVMDDALLPSLISPSKINRVRRAQAAG
jgi:hypothetical protein